MSTILSVSVNLSTSMLLRTLGGLGVILVGILLYIWTGQLSLSIIFWGGHLATRMALGTWAKQLFVWPRVILLLVLGALAIVFLSLLTYVCKPDLGWRAFIHLTDLAFPALVALLVLWSPALALWLWSLRIMEALRARFPLRSHRIIALVLLAAATASVSVLIMFPLGYFSLALGLALLWLGQDFYLDSNRTSMTWLLLWLLLSAMLMAAFAFRQTLLIDREAQAEMAVIVETIDTLDKSAGYHLDIGWDTLSYATARERLPKELSVLAAGEGVQLLNPGRIDWIYHRTDGKGFIQLGRPTGGYQPPLALASLLFISGLLYVLCLRIVSWLLAYPVEAWPYPLFGAASLRVRIQLSFFGVAFAAFFFVGWFTFRFFWNEPNFAYGLLEQLLSIYAFLLIAIGALGIILANSITEPIVRIGEKLSDTNLQNNQSLSWPRNDEIGRLVENYNEMIVALAANAERLAASEREGAWREMAKQVAHEIKNPLTPMKLQLQQLQRLEKSDPERAREWSKTVSHRLIEQIDGLARIATEFSHFARLPEAKPSDFDLRDLLQSAYAVHCENPQQAELSLNVIDEACAVYADRDQLLRVLNNLIRNGLQALPDERAGRIDLTLHQQAGRYLIEVADNGSGIPTEVQDKLFQPNFTTKSSGMGLGLAMCKQIVEQAGGTITFETVVGEGTVFRVWLPKMSSADLERTQHPR